MPSDFGADPTTTPLQLFERLLTSFVNSYIPLPPAAEKPIRVLIHTEMPESSIAPYFEELTNRVKKEGIVRVPL